MKLQACPQLLHFQVSYEQVGSLKRPYKTVVAATPEDSMEAFLPTLPANWRGGVSIYGDELGRLLVKHEVGVVSLRSYKVLDIDENLFDETDNH